MTKAVWLPITGSLPFSVFFFLAGGGGGELGFNGLKGRTTWKANANGKKLQESLGQGLGARERLERRAHPPHLIREVVTVPDEVAAQGVRAVLGGCRLLVRAQEEGHGLPQQGRGAELAQHGREQGGGGQDALFRPTGRVR